VGVGAGGRVGGVGGVNGALLLSFSLSHLGKHAVVPVERHAAHVDAVDLVEVIGAQLCGGAEGARRGPRRQEGEGGGGG